MRYLFTAIFAWMGMFTSAQNLKDTTLLDAVELTAVRAADRTPVAKTDLSREEISRENVGYDLPFILDHTPSVIVNSDAGNGIGYTGIRIRGTDASRVNVTMNGIPYNDAESQGTFFVDLPDIASSANSIQVQRGVGTSSNGAGSFGGTINISTNETVRERNFELNNSIGSFHTFKNSLLFNSGIFLKKFTVDARLSHIRSDGYIERASSRLSSFYTSIAYTDPKSSMRLNVFSGREKTYQAWNGVPEELLQTNRRYNSAGTEKNGDPYTNETDNYIQTHYQIFYNRMLGKNWKTNIALFLTKGKGYYEQYKATQQLSAYGLPDYNDGTTVITETNLIRRLWLDNDFYGTTFSLQYNKTARNIIFGGSLNAYDGKHFGEIIKADVQQAVPYNYKWYDLTAFKKDMTFFGKWTEVLSATWQTYFDMQVRKVNYTINGFRNNPSLKQENNYLFLNPKAGITYSFHKAYAYFSYARSTKEPNRDDFEAGTKTPRPETLNDFELGIEKKTGLHTWGVNLYYMHYRDQLVLTGMINDVGAYTRTNIEKSYRTGIELQGSSTISKWFRMGGNLTISSNKIKDFTEYIDDYDNGGQQTKLYPSSSLPFSPSLISSLTLSFIPFKNADISLISKYVSRQYLDNTSQDSRSLEPYYVQDVRMNYDWKQKKFKALKLFVLVNNIFSEKYEANGYTFSYIYGNKLTTENYYFPMAPVNLMFGINVKL